MEVEDFLSVGQRMRPDLHFNPIFDLEMTYDEAESKEYNIPHFDEFEYSGYQRF